MAFYRAGEREAHIALNRLASAVGIARSQVFLQSLLTLWQNIYSYATILIPSLLMAPKYFAGEIRFGTITQVSFAFNRIEAAASYIINHLDELASLAAETDRLETLFKALEDVEPVSLEHFGPGVMLERTGAGSFVSSTSTPSYVRSTNDPLQPTNHLKDAFLELKGFTLCTPRGERVLCRGLTLSLTAGQSLLLVGPSGVGKSSLLRAIAGLWKTGSGVVVTPPENRLFFLPQKPYMPIGTLRQQLTLPDEPSGDTAEDDNLQVLLSAVCLPDLMARVGGLDAECDWASVLSVGEQQRVAFLRLLRRKPLLAFLDEVRSPQSFFRMNLSRELSSRACTGISVCVCVCVLPHGISPVSARGSAR